MQLKTHVLLHSQGRKRCRSTKGARGIDATKDTRVAKQPNGFWKACTTKTLYGFGFRVSGFGFRVSGFGFRVSGTV